MLEIDFLIIENECLILRIKRVPVNWETEKKRKETKRNGKKKKTKRKQGEK